jgi:hypothetical protein
MNIYKKRMNGVYGKKKPKRPLMIRFGICVLCDVCCEKRERKDLPRKMQKTDLDLLLAEVHLVMLVRFLFLFFAQLGLMVCANGTHNRRCLNLGCYKFIRLSDLVAAHVFQKSLALESFTNYRVCTTKQKMISFGFHLLVF